MKRLVKKLAVAAIACLMVVTLAGCDLLGTMQKSGLSPQLTKHRFTPPGGPASSQDRHTSGSFVLPQVVSQSMP